MNSPSRPGSKPTPDNQPRGGGEVEPKLVDDATAPVDEERLGATRIIAQDPSRSDTALQKPGTTLPTTPLPEAKGPIALGDFRLVQKLGEGAMGAVYLAHQISFDRQVALKVLFKNVGENPKLVERLNREAGVMGLLDHPNIVRGYSVDEIQGWQCIAMEYMDGESLQNVLVRRSRLSIGDALYITLACARALQHAHHKGLIHRDVKPDNVLINKEGEVKLTDFGMVKQLDDEEMSLTQTGHAVGTPWYMPLEQARNAKETDGRCDIYALGCLLYCTLTGQPPFVGRTLVEVIQAKEIGTFPPARQANPEVPEKLDLIIFKMTAKLPRYRYASCGEVVEALEALNLANSRLSYLFPPTQPVLEPSRAQLKPAPAAAVEIAADTSRPTEKKVDVWYIRFPSEDGRPTIKRMLTAEIVRMIESKKFDIEITASRDADEGFRSLATYREFQPLVLGRFSKSAADEKTARYRSLYKKIDEQERQREQNKEKQKPVVSNFRYWMGILLTYGGYGLLIMAALYVLFVLLPSFLRG